VQQGMTTRVYGIAASMDIPPRRRRAKLDLNVRVDDVIAGGQARKCRHRVQPAGIQRAECQRGGAYELEPLGTFVVAIHAQLAAVGSACLVLGRPPPGWSEHLKPDGVERLFRADEFTHHDVPGAEFLASAKRRVEPSEACAAALRVDNRDSGGVGEFAMDRPWLKVGDQVLGIAGVRDRHAVGRSSDFELPNRLVGMGYRSW
jgi:hypothetical protein